MKAETFLAGYVRCKINLSVSNYSIAILSSIVLLEMGGHPFSSEWEESVEK